MILIYLRYFQVGISDGLAVDWVYRHLYWTHHSADGASISVTDLDGSWQLKVVEEGLDKPRAIALFPKKGWVPRAR